MVTVRASDVRLGDLALVGSSYANVIKLNKDLVTLQVFSGTQGVSTTDPVRFLGRPMMVSFSEHLLGRIFDGAGVPRDNGPALTENMIPIGGPSVNPARKFPLKIRTRHNQSDQVAVNRQAWSACNIRYIEPHNQA